MPFGDMRDKRQIKIYARQNNAPRRPYEIQAGQDHHKHTKYVYDIYSSII